MTENLAKYLPVALRIGANVKSTFGTIPQKTINQGRDQCHIKSSIQPYRK